MIPRDDVLPFESDNTRAGDIHDTFIPRLERQCLREFRRQERWVAHSGFAPARAMNDSADLDDGQYTREAILAYESVYGRDFVSPGGQATASRFIEMLQLAPSARVLDAGCGLGGSAFLMARAYGAEVVGLDLSRNMLALASERCASHGLEEKVGFVLGDVLDVGEADTYDAVYSRDAFLHVHDKARLFEVLHRALVPRGRVLITDYCASAPPWTAGFADYVQQRAYDLRTVGEYAGLLEAAGFVEVHGEDLTGEFLDLHEDELARLEASAQPHREQAVLAASWREKIGRIRAGEQRWGLFIARKGG